MSLPRPDSVRAWVLAVVVASVAPYAVTLGHGFVFDDEFVVVRNRHLRSLDQVPTLFRTTEWSGVGVGSTAWRPLTDTTYALNHAAAGLSPWSWHATNVILHAAVALLLLGVGLRFGLGSTAAGAAAVLFALHPIHVEAVANVIGRKDVLAALFALATVLLHARAQRRGGAGLAWPVLAFVAAMLSKESGVVALGLVALHDLAAPPTEQAQPPGARRGALYAAYAVALIGYLLAYRSVADGVGIPTIDDNVLAHVEPGVRVMTAIAAVGKGLALQLLPVGQSPDWSYPSIPPVWSPADPRFLASAGALAAWLGVALALRRRSLLPLVALAWYLGTLFPTSNLAFPIGTLFGERLLYLPSAGLALLAGAGLSALRARIPRAAYAGAALAGALALGGATAAYARVWGDELALFRLAASRTPASARIHAKLAALQLDRSEAPAALAEAERAVALNPWNAEAHLIRARALRALGRFEEEGEATRAALATASGDGHVRLRAPAPEDSSPGDAEGAEAHYRRGVVAREAGSLDDAAAHWRRAIVADPRHAAALGDLGSHHLLRGERELALALFQRAVDADPRLPTAWYNLGLLYRERGEAERSRAAFLRFVETAGPEYVREVADVRRMLDGAGR